MVAQINESYIKLRPTKLLSRLVSYALFEGRPLTTRGQWINPLLFAHFSLEKYLPQIKRVEKPIFVLGTGRSGTTVLGVVLSMHRDVGFLNEPKALWHAIYSEEDVIGNYSRGVAHYRLNESDVDDKIRKNAHRLFGAYLASVFSRRLVDKYPELIFRVPFVREIFPDAQFIFLVRNGWDTCASIDKWSPRHGKQGNGETHDWWGVNQRKWKLIIEELVVPDPYFSGVLPFLSEFKKHSDMAILEWVVTMREGMKRLQENNECIHMIRYEELVESPRLALTELADFLGFSKDDTFLHYGELTLNPTPKNTAFAMHASLRPLFDETMNSLGY